MANPFDEDIPKKEIKKKIVEDALPLIFSKQKIQFNPPEELQCICVCSDLLVISMKKNIILRIDLRNSDKTDEIQISKSYDDNIHNIFLDNLGQHLIISMNSGDNYYLPRSAKKPKLLNKFKGHLISSIGWNQNLATEMTSSFILIGTTKGLIFEAELSINDDKSFFSQGPDIHFKQLFSFVKYKAYPVTGIAFDCLSKNNAKSKRYFIMITVQGRLYQLIGKISFESPYFHPIFSMHDDLLDRFMELPGAGKVSELKLFYPIAGSSPLHFGWLTGVGVYFGNVNKNPPEGVDAVATNTRLIRYPTIDGELFSNPLNFLITEFHILVLFKDRLVILNILNEEVVQIDHFDQTHGKLTNTWYDPVRGSIWVASTQSVFRYKVFKESRDILKIYMSQNEFELARNFCKDDLESLNLVNTKEANYLYSINRFKESAILFSMTKVSFEDIALKLSLLENKEPLRIFLHKKLLNLSSDERTQRTIIMLWLVEIWLNELGSVKDNDQTKNSYNALLIEFRNFLSTPSLKDCLESNKQVIYDLISSHGDNEDIVWFASLVSDFETVLTHSIQKENYSVALSTLTKQINDTNLMYKFSPVLILHVPKHLIDVWIKNYDSLIPEKFIPSLIQYDQIHRRDEPNEAIRYLEFCVNDLRVKTKAIHNYLIALYTKLKMFKQLLTYLVGQGQDADLVCYDLEYALRLCLESGEKRCCVHIYTTMAFYQQAVELALLFDIELARTTADKPSDDPELKRKLWLLIARHVVEKEKDIKKAMEFLKEGSCIRIEDILPFFPDFVTIDHFKDAICSSLQQYNVNLENLKHEMNEATENAQAIRKRIQTAREQCSFVKSDAKCCICNYGLMQRSFYLFPCNHKFHCDCFINEVIPFLDKTARSKVKEIQAQIAASLKVSSKENFKSSEESVTNLEELLDQLVANECLYCGQIMINSIDMPFVEEDKLQSVIARWQ